MRTQLVLVSTAFGLATVVAALEAGLLGATDRRLLLVTSNVTVPEGAPSPLDVPGAAQLAARFDAVLDHNTTIEPLHPKGWAPRQQDLPLWERHLRSTWGLGDDDVELVCESVSADPALALTRIFADADVVVYADGLMSYGPTRTALPDQVGCRVRALLHLDLVPGLAPLLLTEWYVPASPIPAATFRAVVATLAVPEPLAPPTTVVLGQYLAAAGLVSAAEEADLYVEMLARCAEAGHRRIVFKAHPSAPAAYRRRLAQAAAELRVELTVVDDPALVETWFAAGGVDLVVGCFSTALLTAHQLYGLPVAQLGTDLLLERLTPFQNGNRIPVTLVDALVPDLRSWTAAPDGELPSAVDVGRLVEAVGYAMQPKLLAERRNQAVHFLADHPDLRGHYVKRRRLAALELPGGLPRPSWSRAVVRKVRARLAS